MAIQLIADSGATKCEWCLINNGRRRTIITTVISPYFLNGDSIIEVLQKELIPFIKKTKIDSLHFYGTGLGNPNNVTIITKALKYLFKSTKISVNTDMLAAARALCADQKGI